MAPDSTATRAPVASEVLHKARILLADDQPDVLQALRLLLKAEGCDIDTATSPAGVLAAVDARDFDVALIDLNYARDTTSGLEGLSLLSKLQALDTPMPVVVMTAWGTVELAVEAMRRGARDFIQKPWDNERVLAVVRTQVELARALRRSQRLEAENRVLRDQGTNRPTLIAESVAMRPVLDLIARVGPGRCQRPAHRRERHRQGHSRAVAARGVRPRRARPGHGQRRRPVGGPVRKRAVRPRQGRVHRRQERPRRAASSWPRAARCFSTRSPTSR